MKRFLLTSLILCGILVGTASAKVTYYEPRTVIHNGKVTTIWVRRRYTKKTTYYWPAPWERGKPTTVIERHGPYIYRIR